MANRTILGPLRTFRHGGTLSAIGGVNIQTTNYTAVPQDSGFLIAFNISTAKTLTLPSDPPSDAWVILVENYGSATLTISRNGLLIDGAAANLSLAPNQGVVILTDGVNYYTFRGMTAGGRYSQSFSSVSSVTVTHNAGTTKVMVQIFDNSSPQKQIEAEKVERTDANTVTLTFGLNVSGEVIVIW